jgi:hypothetical protein
VVDKGWHQRFDDPIALSNGRELATLEDAARFVQKLPKTEQQRPHWQLTVETLINAAEGRNFIMHARIAVLRALHHDKPAPDTPPRRKAVKKYRIAK